MWSEENIIATGTGDGFIVPTCTQEASFVVMNGDPSICGGRGLFLLKAISLCLDREMFLHLFGILVMEQLIIGR